MCDKERSVTTSCVWKWKVCRLTDLIPFLLVSFSKVIANCLPCWLALWIVTLISWMSAFALQVYSAFSMDTFLVQLFKAQKRRKEEKSMQWEITIPSAGNASWDLLTVRICWEEAQCAIIHSECTWKLLCKVSQRSLWCQHRTKREHIFCSYNFLLLVVKSCFLKNFFNLPDEQKRSKMFT